MRKLMIALFVPALILGTVSVTAYAGDCLTDTPLDRIGDWFATMGKQGMDKDQILANRKADRVVACAKKEAERTIRTVQEATSDMKKQLRS